MNTTYLQIRKGIQITYSSISLQDEIQTLFVMPAIGKRLTCLRGLRHEKRAKSSLLPLDA